MVAFSRISGESKMKSAFRVLAIATVAATLLVRPAAADPRGKSTPGAKAKTSDSTVNIVLHPAAETRPSLKYQLLPAILEPRHENAAVHYLMLHGFESPRLSDKELMLAWIDGAKMPLSELRKARDKHQKTPRKNDFYWSRNPGWVFDEINRGNQCDHCNWGLPLRDPYYESVRVPQFLYLANAARWLSVYARLQIADGCYDEAVKYLQSVLAFGRRIGNDANTYLGCAVGNVIVERGLEQVETFIQQPDAPNLYWALATLPRPMMGIRSAMEQCFHGFYIDHPELRDLGRQSHTPEEWQKMLDQVVEHLTSSYDSGKEPPSQDARKLKIYKEVMERYPQAKKYLIAHGRPAAEVEAMSVPQAVLLCTMQTYDELHERAVALALLPYSKAGRELQQLGKQLTDPSISTEGMLSPVKKYAASHSYPSATRVVCTDRKIASLAIIEAIRIYAAAHDGRLPEKLADITEVPIPNDPTRDEPFSYHREGDAAILESLLPPAAELPLMELRYRIEMKPIEHGSKEQASAGGR
jgi:hypothetical protein